MTRVLLGDGCRLQVLAPDGLPLLDVSLALAALSSIDVPFMWTPPADPDEPDEPPAPRRRGRLTVVALP